MTAVTTLPFRLDGWTVDDLGDLPDDGRRYELVDGALLMTPPPGLPHDEATAALHLLLGAGLPSGLRAAVVPGMYFDRRNYRQPDLVVYRREDARSRGRIEAKDVVLAVEVMSPSSVSTDRVSKPAQYAGAGIPHYWRLELDPAVLVVHRLEGEAYREVARFTDQVVVDEPVEVRFSLPELLS
jgi:Uma2 family endonuclease